MAPRHGGAPLSVALLPRQVKGGFGHLGITTPDVYAACERFRSLGVPFHKSPNAGGMKGLAFIKDPDGYLIEVRRSRGDVPCEDTNRLSHNHNRATASPTATNSRGWSFGRGRGV